LGNTVYSLNQVLGNTLKDWGANSGTSDDDMIVIEGGDFFVEIIEPAGQNVWRVQFSTDPLLISMHIGDAIGDLQQMVLHDKKKCFIISCLKMIAYDAKYRPHT
jgi:hypothetical protein